MIHAKQSLAIAGVAIALAVLAWAVEWRPQHSNEKKGEPLMDKRMTVCVGRFLIDLPMDAQITFTPGRVAGVNISARDGYTEERLKFDIAEREHLLGQKTNEYGRPSLEKKNEVSAVNFKATILYYDREKPVTMIVRGEKIPGAEEGISIEGLGLHADRLYRFEGKSLASPIDENNVAKLLAQFESVDRDTVPTQPGFCTEGGVIHDPIAAEDNESIAIFASLKGHPDVAIRLDSTVNFKEIQESLLSREAHNSVRNEFASSFKNLRKQARTVHGIDGEEVGDKVKEANGTSGFMFTWASMGKLRDVTAPKITLELQTGLGRPGQPVNSSLDDDAVLKLWDAVSSSIRLRPIVGGEKLGNAGASSSVPLGELAESGRICPTTGFWECNQSGMVVPNTRKFFRQGELMPHAVSRTPLSLWQKLRGSAPSYPVTTMWKLVAYEVQPHPENRSRDIDGRNE